VRRAVIVSHRAERMMPHGGLETLALSFQLYALVKAPLQLTGAAFI